MTFTAGRVLLAIGIALFGVQHLVNGQLVPGFFLSQPWTPPLPPLAGALGAALIAGGLAMLIPRTARVAALGLAALIAVVLVVMNAAQIPAVITSGAARSGFFEPFAIASVLLIVAAVYGRGEPRNNPLDLVGRMLYAFSLAVFGVQHFLSAADLAALVPAWMPQHLGLVYFTGAAFVAAGFAIALNTLARTAAYGIALMFGLWVLTLHIPLVVASVKDAALWEGLFVAIAMCGCGLVAGSVQPRRRAAAS